MLSDKARVLKDYLKVRYSKIYQEQYPEEVDANYLFLDENMVFDSRQNRFDLPGEFSDPRERRWQEEFMKWVIAPFE
ncbi:MAG: hypothetical protein HYU64_09660 [Armatimonadetes bacterium]|nr:hypothetical protein [Armatimonadota bacterium]